MKRTVTLLASLAILAPGSAVASADTSPTGTSYGQGGVKNVTGTHDSGSATTPAGSSTTPSGGVSPSTATRSAAAGGSLPFTGIDVGALAVGGIVLLGTGVLVRRATSDDRS